MPDFQVGRVYILYILNNEHETSTGGKHFRLNCSPGMLAGSTPMTEIFCEYARLIRI